MPNKLSDTKIRKTITENKTVIAIFNKIAKKKDMSFIDLVRVSMRDMIRNNIDIFLDATEREDILDEFKPLLSEVTTRKELSKFKKSQREFDKILLDLNIEDKEEMQNHNSIIPSNIEIKVMEFESC